MTERPNTRTAPLAIDTPEQLRALLGADFTFSDQQFTAITAPLGPAVVIAGAGSGKTTVMAARVVWLVATGRVSPSEVLGLTFTTKATAELACRIRDSLRSAGLLPARGLRPLGGDEEEVEEQLEQAVAALRAEEFVARPGNHCERCSFQAICPTKAAGSVLS